MVVLVTGSRNWTDKGAIREALVAVAPTKIIHGAARGADSLAQELSIELGVACESFPAQWDQYGRAAGPIRNQQMLDEGRPDVVLAFPMPGSIGTRDMIRRAEGAGVRVLVHGEDDSDRAQAG